MSCKWPSDVGLGDEPWSGGVGRDFGLLVVVEGGEIPGEKPLRPHLALPDPLARHAPTPPEILQSPGLVLRQALLKDCPSKTSDPLANARQRLLHRAVLLQ